MLDALLRDHRFDFSAFWALIEERARERGSVIYSRQTRLSELAVNKAAATAQGRSSSSSRSNSGSGGNTEVLTGLEKVASALQGVNSKCGAGGSGGNGNGSGNQQMKMKVKEVHAEQLLECYIDNLDFSAPVGLEARILHYKDKKGHSTIASYGKNVPVQQDNRYGSLSHPPVSLSLSGPLFILFLRLVLTYPSISL